MRWCELVSFDSFLPAALDKEGRFAGEFLALPKSPIEIPRRIISFISQRDPLIVNRGETWRDGSGHRAPRNFRIGENDRKNRSLSFGSIARDIFLEKSSLELNFHLSRTCTCYLREIVSRLFPRNRGWKKISFFCTRNTRTSRFNTHECEEGRKFEGKNCMKRNVIVRLRSELVFYYFALTLSILLWKKDLARILLFYFGFSLIFLNDELSSD